MSLPSQITLVSVFVRPEQVSDFNLSQWDLLIRQARRANVLGRLGWILEQHELLSQVPKQVIAHLQSATTYANQFALSLEWEIICIERALKGINVPLVFLKGSAYFLAQNIACRGRVFSDVDFLVVKEKLGEVESALHIGGWKPGSIDEYDQKYYREWMHEIPPMLHMQRHTSIDVHHNILPKTCKFCPDAKKLLANIVKIPGKTIWLLAPEDRVLHSATHLFHEGELEHGFRDLSDLDLLLKEFSTEANFWVKLLQRATELNQQVPLYYALRYTSLILQTSVPKEVLTSSEKHIPNRMKQKFMDALFIRALMPDHQSCNDQWTGLARWLLFIRSHWLKMPGYLLIRHLFRKSILRLQGKSRH